MGTMQQALSDPTPVTPQSQRKVTTPAAKQSATDMIASALKGLEARRTRSECQKADATDAAEQEKVAEQVAKLYLGDAELTVELTQLNKERSHAPRGSVRSEEIRNEIDQKTALQGTVKQALEALRVSNPSAHTEGARRYGRRQEATQMASANREVSATSENIRSRITGAVQAEFSMELSPEQEVEYKRRGWATVSFDRRTHGPVKPEDPAEADVTVSLAEKVSDLQSFRDEENQKIIAELVRGGFYISARRDPDGKGSQLPSELDLLRDETGTVRKASAFLAGNGQRYVAKVGRGFVVIENRDGKFVAVKTSDAKAGRALFTVPDRQSQSGGARVARKSAQEIANDSKSVTATDLSGVWYDPLRMALEEDLRREAESVERREAADELRNISGIENPLTLGDVALGGTGTVPVSIPYEDPENNRRHIVTFQVTGNGTTFSVTSTVPGTEETIKRVKHDRATRKVLSSKPFLPEFIGKETPLGVLEKDPLWRLVRDLNRPYERDWRLVREAERRNAVPVTCDNFDGLIGLEGQDGPFAVRATLRKNIAERGQEPHYVYNPVGYIMERNGSKVKTVWAVPGTSANYAERMIGNEYEIADLPSRLRFVLGNVHWTFTKEDAPAHLRPVKRQDAPAATDTEE